MFRTSAPIALLGLFRPILEDAGLLNAIIDTTAMLPLCNNYDGDLCNSGFSVADHPMSCNNKIIPQFDQRRRK
ncbi:hypothetical protein [Rhizobium sullae]|uniref:hypothetical protein n=1 Tax=Rhizobium sullae TaxID=50338 RepID=UPI00117B12B5|nr:hypothetical protein [Rhizobium sullae]